MSSSPVNGPNSAAVIGLGWGFEHLDIDNEALNDGRVVLRSASGVFPNGLAFVHPSELGMPLVLDLPPASNAAPIFLACTDDTAGDPMPVLHLTPNVAGGHAIAVAHVQRRNGNGPWELEEGFLPPLRRVQASRRLSQFLNQTTELVEARCRSLAMRLSNRTTFAEIADVLMLHDLNQAFAELRHLQKLPDLHPERLFVSLARLAAGICTYSDSRLASDLPLYDHAEPGPPFQELARMIDSQLSLKLESLAAVLPIERRKYGVNIVLLGEHSKLGYGQYVLQVLATLPAEVLRSRFPSQVKIGPIEKIRDLVNLQLPGIVLKPLAVVPHELPYHAGAAYFGLDDAGSGLWKSVETSPGLAFHVAGDFPDLNMTFWRLPARS